MLDFAFKATFAAGQTTSGTLNLQHRTLVGIFVPAGFAGGTLTFMTSPDNGTTFYPATNEDGTTYSLTIAPSKYVMVDPSRFCGIEFLQIVAAAQGSGAVLTLATRDI